MRLANLWTVLGLVSALSACSQSERDISMRVLDRPNNGPDEFAVLPNKPLEAPSSYTDLPVPTPNAANLTDRNPKAEGIAALGGNPARLSGTGVPSSDVALVRYVGRKGTDPAIREKLAAEDEDFRRRKSRFTKIRIVKTDRYAQAYKRETLDAYSEWYKYRRTGVKTPAAPPRGE